jgi:hypothetical protein
MARPYVPYHLDYMVLLDYVSVCLFVVYPGVVHPVVVNHVVVHLAEFVAYLCPKLVVYYTFLPAGNQQQDGFQTHDFFSLLPCSFGALLRMNLTFDHFY